MHPGIHHVSHPHKGMTLCLSVTATCPWNEGTKCHFMAFNMPEISVHDETGHSSEIKFIGGLWISLLHSRDDSQGPDKGLDSSCPQHLSGKGNLDLLQQLHHIT